HQRDVVGRDIYPWLDGEDVPDLELVAHVVVLRGIVHFEAEPVTAVTVQCVETRLAASVRRAPRAGSGVVGRFGRLDQAESRQAFRNHRSSRIAGEKLADAVPDLSHVRFLRVTHQLIDVALPRTELAVHGEGPRDVGGVVVV